MKRVFKNALKALDIRDAVEQNSIVRFIILLLAYIFVITFVLAFLGALAKVYPALCMVYFAVLAVVVIIPIIDRIRELNKEDDDDSP